MSVTNVKASLKSVNSIPSDDVGVQVINGKDATINGYNTIEIRQGKNIDITQENAILTINNSYDDSDIKEDISFIQSNVLSNSDIEKLLNIGGE